MYSRNSFGSYYPIDSAIHRLNPVIKVFNSLIILFLLIFSSSIYINVFMFALVLVMMLLSYVPFKYYLRAIWFMRYIYILIAFIFAYFSLGMQTTLLYILKLIVAVEYLNILAYTTSPSESAYGIEKFLSMFNFLFLKISKISFKISSIIRYIPLQLIVEYKLLKAQSSRGIDYYNSNILGKFFTSLSVRSNVMRLTNIKNKEIAFASELKLYNIQKYRTNYRTNKVCFYDIFFTILHFTLLYAYIVEKGIL